MELFAFQEPKAAPALAQILEEEQSSDESYEPSKNTNIILFTDVKMKQVEAIDVQKEENKLEYRYNCPICLRYFNHMLVCSCCKNYLCRLCIRDLQEMEKRNEKFKAVCPYGCAHVDNDQKGLLCLDDVK